MSEGLKTKNVVCFGEILWDKLPASTKPGGAPMNVAYHLNKMHVNAQLISRVGQDVAGDNLLNLLSDWGLSTDLVGKDTAYQTSEVRATVSENNEVSYEILFPVAWDFIPYQRNFTELLAEADALVFGSLVTRNETSSNTLFQLLEKSTYNVFDVNLRAPHYTPEIIRRLLLKTNLLKLNEHELLLISNWFSNSCQSEAACIKLLQEEFGINEIVVTKGSRGASFFTPETQLDCAAYKVKVADTVGSGDAFLAALLAQKLQGKPISVALSYAAALGAFVTKNYGACPDYTLQDLDEFRRSYQEHAA